MTLADGHWTGTALTAPAVSSKVKSAAIPASVQMEETLRIPAIQMR
jgi:hypothetical protein